MTAPDWWAFLLLALAAFRTTRLVGWDTITAPVRSWVSGYDDTGNPTRDRSEHRMRRGEGFMRFVTCPWCSGFWQCLAWAGAWYVWPVATLVAAAPLALSTVVGLVAKNLDAA